MVIFISVVIIGFAIFGFLTGKSKGKSFTDVADEAVRDREKRNYNNTNIDTTSQTYNGY